MKLFSLYLDFDNTIVNSSKAIIDILNKKYNINKNYKNGKKYNFTDLFPFLNEDEIMCVFNTSEMFEILEFEQHCDNILSFLETFLEINIVSYGTLANLSQKKDWIKNNMKYVNKFYPLLGNKFNKFVDKSNINMIGSVFIDDNIECLRSSNAEIKILFKPNGNNEWNKSDNIDEIYIVNTWKEILEILSFYIKNGGII